MTRSLEFRTDAWNKLDETSIIGMGNVHLNPDSVKVVSLEAKANFDSKSEHETYCIPLTEEGHCHRHPSRRTHHRTNVIMHSLTSNGAKALHCTTRVDEMCEELQGTKEVFGIPNAIWSLEIVASTPISHEWHLTNINGQPTFKLSTEHFTTCGIDRLSSSKSSLCRVPLVISFVPWVEMAYHAMCTFSTSSRQDSLVRANSILEKRAKSKEGSANQTDESLEESLKQKSISVCF